MSKLSRVHLGLTPKDLLEVSHVPEGLFRLAREWMERRFENPFAAAQDLETTTERLTRAIWWLTTFGWLFGTVANICLVPVLLGLHEHFFIVVLFGSAVCSVFAFAGSWILKGARRDLTKDNAAEKFIDDLDELASLFDLYIGIRYDAHYFSSAPKDDLTRVAKNILVAQAVKILLKQEEEKNVPQELKTSKQMIEQFGYIFDKLKLFGLTENGFSPYFDLAKQEIKDKYTPR